MLDVIVVNSCLHINVQRIKFISICISVLISVCFIPLSDIILTLIHSVALARAAEQQNMHPDKFLW